MSQKSRQTDNPYVGPRTFEREQGRLYFGREREARDLLSLVISERLVLFYGQSAGGKSSLLNTRLIPGLEEKGFEVLPKGRVGGMAPPEIPVDNIFVYNLLLSLNREAGETRPLRDPNMTISEFLWEYGADLESVGAGEDATSADSEAMTIASAAPETGTAEEDLPDIWPRAVIIDQFEEILITNLHEWEKREDFFRQLADALAADEYLWVILAIREDYVAGLEPYSHLLPGKLKARFYLQRMGYDAALQAVTGPVAERRPFDEGVAEDLVDHLRQLQPYEQEDLPGPAVGQYVKPVQLQVVCYYLWEDLREHPGERITHDDLKRLAGGEDLALFVDQALGKFYDRAIEEVVEDRPSLTEFYIRDWFEHKLITKSRTRAPVLQEARTTGGLDNDIVGALERHFLLRSESRAGNLWFELVHDRLILPVLRSNADWRGEHPLIDAAERWENAGQPDELLYRGKTLKEALERPEAEIPVVRAFLDKAQAVEKQRTQARNYRRMGVIAGLLTLAIIVLAGVTIWAINSEIRAEQAMETAEVERINAEYSRQTAEVSYGTATAALGTAEVAYGTATAALSIAHKESTAVVQQRDRAEDAEATSEAALAGLEAENRRYNALDLAEAAKRSLGADQDLSLLLAVQAVRLHLDADEAPPIEAEDALQQAVLKARGEAAVILGRAERVRELVLTVREFGAYDVDWSPDGGTLATVGEEGTAILWDALSGEEVLQLSGHEDSIFGVAFGPEGERLATAAWDGTRVWDAVSGESLLVLEGGASTYDVSWSPDGSILAAANLDGEMILWDAATGEELVQLSGHEGEIIGLAFSPDGQRLATASPDGTARVWDASSGEPLLTLAGEGYGFYDVAWSPDGATLVTVGERSESILWDAASGEELLRLPGPEGEVYGAAFSPDGRYVATANADGTASVWAATTGVRVRLLEGHEEGVIDLAFSPDGMRLATASIDGTARIWDLQEEVRERRVPTQAYLDFDDDNHLLEGHEDGVLAVWDISSGEQVEAITATAEISITGVAFGEDGARLMATGGEEWLRAWAVASGQEASLPPLEARDMLTGVVDTAFSADGARLAAVSEGGTIGLWNLEDGQLLWSLQLRELPSVVKEPTPTGEGRQAPVGTPEPGAPAAEAKPEEAKMVVGQLALDQDGSLLAVVIEFQQAVPAESQLAPTSQSRILAWDVDAAEELPVVPMAERIEGLVFSPGGDQAAAATELGDVLVWDPRTREEPLRLTAGDRVDALAFSPDGARLATATWQETRIWDVSNREGKSLTLLSIGEVWDLAFSPDGDQLVVAALGGGLKLYPLDVTVLLGEACSTVTRNLTQVEWETNERAVEFPQICPQRPLHDTVILALVREGKVQEARDYVAQAGRRARAAGYELGITSGEAIANAFFAWAEQLAAERDYDEALEKLDLALQEVPDLGSQGEVAAANVAFAICNQGSEFGPKDLVSPACEGIAAMAPEIGVGGAVTDTVDSQTGDIWAFAGTEGQLLTVAMDWLHPELDPYVNLYAPDGQWLASDDDGGGGLNALIAGFQLPQDGVYLVNADGLGDRLGAYTLTVEETKVEEVRLGETVTGTVEQDTLWTFGGQEGQNVRIELRLLGDWTGAKLTLVVEGRTVETRYEPGPSVLVLSVLPASGTYSVQVQALEGDAGAYTLSLDEFQARGTLQAGDTVTAELSGAAGDVWTYDGHEGVWIEMVSPDLAPSLALHSRNGQLAGQSVAASPEGRVAVGLSGVPEPPQKPVPLLIVARSPELGVSGSYTLSLSPTKALDLPQACGLEEQTPDDLDLLNDGDVVILAPPRPVDEAWIEGPWLEDFGVDEADLEGYVGLKGIVYTIFEVDGQGCPFVLVEIEGRQLVPWRVRDLRRAVIPEG